METVLGDTVEPGRVFQTWKKTGNLNWNDISNPSNPEPNDNGGVEECVRMKGGLFNDAFCYLTHTSSRRDQIGMGYICENHSVNNPRLFTNRYCDILNTSGMDEKLIKRSCLRMTKLVDRVMKNTKKDRTHNCSNPHSYSEWEVVKKQLKEVSTTDEFKALFSNIVHHRLSTCTWYNAIANKIASVYGQAARQNIISEE